MIGWVYEEEKGLVDFGIMNSDFVGPDIPIVFNVNGNILDKLGEEP